MSPLTQMLGAGRPNLRLRVWARFAPNQMGFEEQEQEQKQDQEL
jgi:hypothetical protein